ncbi:GntR family transcriptional regulator [Lactiplantibacillus carotarum]|uniref:GntR family transcriptional regulator n=1 Tax=Lactiplantibacillus carotarum TaxID=2993456 RepID=UPI00298EDCBC|nr:GntR family transcriptional regulator [Lactiplantibacillus carotarum]
MESKYQRVINGLKQAILAGKYQINEKLPTETALMEQYQVSRYTVRRAVGELENDHFIYRIQGGGMFVQDWQKDWGEQRANNLIGVISTHIADYIFPQIIYGLDQVVSDQDYSLLISNTHNDHQKERQSLLSMLDTNVAGLIIEPTQSALPNPNMDLYEELKKKQIPVIFINATYPNLDFPAVTTDDQRAEKELVEYLFSKGHQQLVGLFQIDDIQGVHRMQGFVQAYQEHPQIAYKSNVVMYQSGDSFERITTNLLPFLAREDAPTAIVCYNDQLAIQLIDFLKQKQYRVPDDISVVGFDDYQMDQYISPRLTTMSHEKEGMGQAAGRLMLDLLHHKSIESIKFKPQLIERDSVRNSMI